MSTMTTERPTQAISTFEAEFGWNFFTPKKWTVQKLLEELQAAYKDVNSDTSLPPSFDQIVSMLCDAGMYSVELMYRAYYEKDVYHYGSLVHEDIQEALDSGWAESIEDYTYRTDEDWGGQLFEIDEMDEMGWGKAFLKDVRDLLKLSGLFYIYVNYEDYDQYYVSTGQTLKDTHLLEPRNCPIVEVW